MLPDWNDLPNDCRESMIKAAGWFTEDWEAGQCALDMYIELKKTLPPAVFPLFQKTSSSALEHVTELLVDTWTTAMEGDPEQEMAVIDARRELSTPNAEDRNRATGTTG